MRVGNGGLTLQTMVLPMIGALALNAASAAEPRHDIRAWRPAPIAGAHGLAPSDDEDDIVIADTYRRLTPGRSGVYLLREYAFSAEPAKLEARLFGQEIAGVAAIDGGYLVSDFGASRVLQTTPDFAVVRTWEVTQPWNARMTPQGVVLAVTNNALLSLHPDGSVESLLESLDYPFDFAPDPQGRGVWISEQGIGAGAVALWRFEERGGLSRAIESDYPWRNPEGLLARGCDVYALDTERGDLVRIDANGVAERINENLGLPIQLIARGDDAVLIFANHFEGGPALIELETPASDCVHPKNDAS